MTAAETIAEKGTAFATALPLVDAATAEIPLEPYEVRGSMFGPVSTRTPSEQRVDLVLQVADWLREET